MELTDAPTWGNDTDMARVVLISLLLWTESVRALVLGAPSEPLFTFGAVADIQYADKDTAGKRQYRRALEILPRCIEKFNEARPAFVVQCGDLYDGYEKLGDQAIELEKSQTDALKVLAILRRIEPPLYHVLGNHCLRAGKDFMKRELGLERFHYDFRSPKAKGWRFVVLDGNDAGYELMSADQIAWFKGALNESAKADERVIVFSHYALLKEAARHHRLKNAAEVLPAIEASGRVAAWVAGHDHAGGYFEKAGVHHLTLKGLVESKNEPDFALFSVFSDRIVEDGFGEEPDRELMLRGLRDHANRASSRLIEANF